VATDRVENFDNTSLTIERQGRGDIAINVFNSQIVEFRSGREQTNNGTTVETSAWTVAPHDNDGLWVARLAQTPNNSDQTDYLAGGFWLHLEGDYQSLKFERADVGAFVGGPELNGTPTIPETGSATYKGEARGLYAYRFGSSNSEIPEGSFTLGDYKADAELSANFSLMTVDGCIGCGREADLSEWSRLQSVLQDASTTMPFNDKVTVDVTLGSAPIRSDGTFVGTDIDVQAFDGPSNGSSNGSWGGKFSNVSVDGAPRLAAGTTSVNWTESDGDSGSLVGVFLADQQSVPPVPEPPVPPVPEPPGDALSPINEALRTATRDAANSTPRFGSVTQSSNTDSQGMTTDSVNTSHLFDGDLNLTIRRQGQGNIFLGKV